MYRLDDLLQIGDAARLKGVSINTLRRWEEDGKILPVRTEGGHRRYRVADLLTHGSLIFSEVSKIGCGVEEAVALLEEEKLFANRLSSKIG